MSRTKNVKKCNVWHDDVGCIAVHRSLAFGKENAILYNIIQILQPAKKYVKLKAPPIKAV
mgnify:FL=1